MMFPFRMPYFGYPYNNYYSYPKSNYFPYNNKYVENVKFNNAYSSNNNNVSSNPSESIVSSKADIKTEEENRNNSSDDYLFEIFGLKLYFDDILIICILFFLYEQGVKDQELFISLILLLLG